MPPPAPGASLPRRAAFLAVSAASFWWAMTGSMFRDAESAWTGAIALPLALAVASVVLAFATEQERRAAQWFALLLVGSAASLLLVKAGRTISYQHVRPATTLSGYIAYAILAVQGVILVLAGRSLLRRGWQLLRQYAPTPVLLIAGAGFVLTSSTLSPKVSTYAAELMAATLLQLLSLATFGLTIASLPAHEGWRGWLRLDTLLGARMPDEAPRGGTIDRVTVMAALWATAVSALLAFFVYQRHPHVPDEVVYLLQARYQAMGMLWMQAPPVPDAFNIHLMFLDGARWFSPVPLGWPFVLTIGSWLGAPWLINPILGGINVLLTSLLLQEFYDRRTARLATLLLALSPWHLFLAMSLMTHQLTLLCALAGALGVARARRHGGITAPLIGGLFVGGVSLIRPLEGMVTALLLGFWSLGARGRVIRLAPSIALTLGAMASGALALPYNQLLAGNWRTFPIMMYTDRYYAPGSNDLGFGPDRGLGWGGFDPFPGHGALDVLVNANLNLFATNVELLGWATGSLWLMVLYVLRGRLRRADWWMVIAIASVAGIHSFYWFSGGPDFAARYWFLIIVPCLALTASAAHRIGAEMEERSVRQGERRLMTGTLLLSVAAVFTFIPWRSADKYYHFRGMRPDVRTLAISAGFGRSLVFIRGERFPDYMSAAIYNPVDLQADVPIYVWDFDAKSRAEVLRAYPDRPVWVVDGPNVSGRGFAVSAGPLPPGTPPPLPPPVPR